MSERHERWTPVYRLPNGTEYLGPMWLSEKDAIERSRPGFVRIVHFVEFPAKKCAAIAPLPASESPSTLDADLMRLLDAITARQEELLRRVEDIERATRTNNRL